MSSSAERMARKRERDKGLEAARARGRAYGEHEASRQGLLEPERSERIERAEAYAVWLFEGRPVEGLECQPYRPGIVP